MSVLAQNVVPTEALAHTLDFRVQGLIHVRRGMPISRFLNQRERTYLPMTVCRVFRPGHEQPPAEGALLYETDFAAVPKSRLAFLVGGIAEPPGERVGREPRQVCVMYPGFVLTGTMFLPARVRMSDHLSNLYGDKPFVELADVTVGVPREGARVEQFEVASRQPLVTVNVALAGALFDVAEPVGRDFRSAPQ
ncbi:MAG TPA: hypothetical protein VKY42_03730 [Trueperaceae bacterium]|nr:hypothetical protein [Trueperaceae bacterium]